MSYQWRQWEGYGRDGYGRRTWYDLVRDEEVVGTFDNDDKRTIDRLVADIKDGADLDPTVASIDTSKGVAVFGPEAGR